MSYVKAHENTYEAEYLFKETIAPSFPCAHDEHEDEKNVGIICEQLYDLARIQNAPLPAEAMTKFIARSNEIMLMLAK